MLKFSEILEFSRENSYFERIRMVRMVRMVRSLADRTFQLRAERRGRDDGLAVRARCGCEARTCAVLATVPIGEAVLTVPIDPDRGFGD